MKFLFFVLLLTGCSHSQYVSQKELQFRIGLYCNNVGAKGDPTEFVKTMEDCREEFGYPRVWESPFSQDVESHN